MAVSLSDMRARLTITAGVTGTELLDKFGGKLNTVGKTADSVNKQMSSLDRTVRGLAAGFSVAGLAAFAAEAARVGIQLDAFSKQLGVGFGSAGALELEKIRDTMRSLGIAQDEALGSAVRFTSALKLSGQTMGEANKAFESASKLILSNKLSADGAQRVYYAMAQIASKGKLMSEELNGQLGDVLSGFSQQVAKAMNMTTAALYKAMQEGKVSSQQFFEALNKIGDGIDPAALDSAARSLGVLKNQWFDFKESLVNTGMVKEALDTASVSIQFLAQNGSTLIAVVGTGLVAALGSFISKSVMATAASFAEAAAKRASLLETVRLTEAENVKALADLRAAEAALAHAEAMLVTGRSALTAAAQVETATAAVALSEKQLLAARNAAVAAGAGMGTMGRGAAGLTGMLGGGLGIAITAVTMGLLAYGIASEQAEKHLEDNAHLAKKLGVELTAESAAAFEASNQAKGLGKAQDTAEISAWSFKNASDGLTKSLWEQARAARAARVELLQKQVTEAKKTLDDSRGMSREGANDLASNSAAAFRRGNVLEGTGSYLKLLGNNAVDILSGGEMYAKGARDATQARKIMFAAQSQIDMLQTTSIGKSDLGPDVNSPAATAPGGGGGKTKTPKAATGPTVVQIEKSYQDMLNSITQEEIRARQQLVTNTGDRFKFEEQSLSSEISEKRASLVAAKNFTAAQYRLIDQAISDLEVAKKAAMEKARQTEILHNANEIQNAELETQVQMKQFSLDFATTAAERRQIALDIIDAEQKIRENKLREVIATGSETEAAVARAQLANLPAETKAKKDKSQRDNQGPLAAKMTELHKNTDDINTALENVGAKGLQSLEDGMIGVLNGTKTVAQAFTEMANQIIADLLRIAVEKLIVSAIGGMFADGGAFSGGTKMFANGGAFSGGTEFFATGGAFANTVVTRPTAFGMANGKTGIMGEAGPEAVMPLRRTASGKLGVEVVGGRGGSGGSPAGDVQQNNVNVTVNVEGGQTKVQSSSNDAASLGRVIANVVRQELVNQQRPGGLLSR